LRHRLLRHRFTRRAPRGAAGYDAHARHDPHTAGWGATTVFSVRADAYSQVAPNLAGDLFGLHQEGKAGFGTNFVAAPADDEGGLGPIFNESSCEECHVRASRSRGIRLLRFSLGGVDDEGGPVPAPGFGSQLQDRANAGVEIEGDAKITRETIAGVYSDGTPYELRRPLVTVTRAYIPFSAPEWSLRARRIRTRPSRSHSCGDTGGGRRPRRQ